MKLRLRIFRAVLIGISVLIIANPAISIAVADEDALSRGKYIYDAAGCGGCHSDERINGFPVGGRALKTPFGEFRVANITPSRQTGIGNWSAEDFHHALRNGIAPGGRQLFPVFPFPAFSQMTDQDISDLFAYLSSLDAVENQVPASLVQPPFGWRSLMVLWRFAFFKPGPYQPDPGHNAEWNRGNYLAHAVAHCEECHTPRNSMGALSHKQAFSGNIGGPDGQNAPNITSDETSGIGKWTIDEIETLLKTGQTPDFDAVASGMKSVVKGTAKLTDADRHAIAVYLKTVPAIFTPPPSPPKPAN